MRRRTWIALAISTILASAACDRGKTSEVPDPAPEPAPPSLAGTAKDFDLLVTRVHAEETPTGLDLGFEVKNQGRSIVDVESTRRGKASEVVLHPEVYRNGNWEQVPVGADPASSFEELWPGATRYGRATFPLECRWGRVRVRARGLVGAKDGAIVSGAIDVFSDVVDLSGSK
jgi:hypothetical protein